VTYVGPFNISKYGNISWTVINDSKSISFLFRDAKSTGEDQIIPLLRIKSLETKKVLEEQDHISDKKSSISFREMMCGIWYPNLSRRTLLEQNGYSEIS